LSVYSLYYNCFCVNLQVFVVSDIMTPTKMSLKVRLG
jgi:hypothetical protein